MSSGLPAEALRPLNGIRVLSCISITIFHVGLGFVAAGSAWHWYDILDSQKWANVVVGAHFMFAMAAFLILTGLLAASSLLPQLEDPKRQPSKVIKSYYKRRLWRILPAFYVALGILAIAKIWPEGWANSSKEAARVRDYYRLGATRAAWTLPLLISNITLDMRSFIFCWNIADQMQFYLLFPLAILLLKPRAPSFRSRLTWSCIAAIVIATLYRIAVVIAFNIQAQLPIGAHSHVTGKGGMKTVPLEVEIVNKAN
ncbi:hypothetical protein WJX74_008067 [Apatococcus lobatus]|uniref:Acyltransferase 3 domain-containing protein n=1 Tax=Apatococcus lobatus TaxID=904363 RepID=A0AAW1QC91_9CHLO